MGFAPAPTIATIPEIVISRALTRPNQLKRSSVRGNATQSVATENMIRRSMLQRPRSESTERACCPDKSSEPCKPTQSLSTNWTSSKKTTHGAKHSKDNGAGGQYLSKNRTANDVASVPPSWKIISSHKSCKFARSLHVVYVRMVQLEVN